MNKIIKKLSIIALRSRRFVPYFIYIFLILLSLNGVFYFILGSLNLSSLRIWKELYTIILTIILWITAKHINKRYLALTIVLILWGIFMSIFHYIYLDNYLYLIYQYKLDTIWFILILAFLNYIKYENSSIKRSILINLIKLILSLSLLNALIALLEEFIFVDLIKKFVLNFNNGAYGNVYGIRIITTQGKLRAFGLLTGFVQLGDFLLLAITIFLASLKKLKEKFNNIQLSFVFIILSLGLLTTWYKTAILGYFLVTGIFLVQKISIKKFTNKLITILFLIMLPINLLILSTQISSWLYQLMSQFSPYLAENSISLRMKFTNEILHLYIDPFRLFLGLNYGQAGTYSNIFPKQIPLDSTFIYLLSNYGILGLIIFYIGSLTLGFRLLRQIIRDNNHYLIALFAILWYIFCIEFAYNNMIINIPFNIFASFLFITISHSHKDQIHNL